MDVALKLSLLGACLCLIHLTSGAPSLPASNPGNPAAGTIHTSLEMVNESHDRVRRQLDKANGFSLIAIGVFGAFVKYLAYHFISKNSEGGARSLEDSLLDLTRITSCLSKEPGQLLSNFHLHCFFPTFFSKNDNDIISGVITGSSQKEAADLVLVRGERVAVASSQRHAREASKSGEKQKESQRIRRGAKPSGTVLSILALAAFGAFFFYFAYFNITKYLGGGGGGGGGGARLLVSDSFGESLREVASILQCLHEEDFVLRLHCFFEVN